MASNKIMGIYCSPFLNIHIYISVQVLCFRAVFFLSWTYFHSYLYLSSHSIHLLWSPALCNLSPYLSKVHKLFSAPLCRNADILPLSEFCLPWPPKTSNSLRQAKHLTCFLKVGSLVTPYKFIRAQHMVNYNIYESTALKPKSKFSSIWSQGTYLQMISNAKLTSSSLTILIIDCWVCAAHFSFTKPSFFSSSSSLALRRFLHLFWSSCSSASFSLTVPSSL